MLRFAKQLDSILCGPGKNPALLSYEWAALDAFYGMPEEERARAFSEAICDPKSSGPLLIAMRAILKAVS